MTEFATCSFPEYRPDIMGGIPVRTSNGHPRYKLRYPLLHSMACTFPDRSTIRGIDYPTFVELYRAKLDAVGIDEIREQAASIRRQEGAADDVPIVFLCFEQLAKKPDQWCHRSTLAAFLSDQLGGQSVPEFGAMPKPEIRAQENPLF